MEFRSTIRSFRPHPPDGADHTDAPTRRQHPPATTDRTPLRRPHHHASCRCSGTATPDPARWYRPRSASGSIASERRAAYGDTPTTLPVDGPARPWPDAPHPADDPTLIDPTWDVPALPYPGADAPHPADDPTLTPGCALALDGLHDASLGTIVDVATQALHRLRDVAWAIEVGPAHIDELLRLLGAMDAGNAAVIGLTGQLQPDRLVQRTTGLSFASLLACQSPLPTTDHRRLLRNTLILRSMPHLSDAVATGRVPAAVLPSILPELRRLKVAQRHGIDGAFAADGLLAPLAPDELIDAVRDAVTLLLRPDLAREDEQRAFNQRMLSFTPHDEGWLSGYFELDAEAGATLLEAVDAAAPPPASGPDDITKHAIDGRSDTPPAPDSWEWRSRNRQRAEGLVRLAESYLGGTDPRRDANATDTPTHADPPHATDTPTHADPPHATDTPTHADPPHATDIPTHADPPHATDTPTHADPTSHRGLAAADRATATDGRGTAPPSSPRQMTTPRSAATTEHTGARSDRDAPDRDAPDRDAPDRDAPDRDAPDRNAPDRDAATSNARPSPSRPSRWRRPRPKLLVLADIAALVGDDANAQAARLLWRAASGPIRLTPDAVRRLASDADLRFILHDDGHILGTTAPTATIPVPLRDAVHARDQGCRFPSCRAPVQWCDLHHVRPRHEGGPTTADNLTALCRRHHTAVTTGRWRLTMTPDGVVSVRRGRYTATSLPPHRRRLLPLTRPDPDG